MDLDPASPGRSRARWRVVAVASVALFVMGGLLAAARQPAGIDLPLAGVIGAAADDFVPSTTTTTEPPGRTYRRGPLPIPEPLPTSAYAATPEITIGRIEIPAIDVVDDLQVGMTLTAINRGPSHWPGTALPGEFGNAVVAGHRTTYSAPFNRLDELVEGDLVHFHLTNGESHTYEVRGVIIVPEAALGIAAQDEAFTATLFACHPKGSATHRVVAKLRLLDDRGRPVSPDDELPPIDVGLRDGDEVLMVRDGVHDPAELTDPFGTVEES